MLCYYSRSPLLFTSSALYNHPPSSVICIRFLHNITLLPINPSPLPSSPSSPLSPYSGQTPVVHQLGACQALLLFDSLRLSRRTCCSCDCICLRTQVCFSYVADWAQNKAFEGSCFFEWSYYSLLFKPARETSSLSVHLMIDQFGWPNLNFLTSEPFSHRFLPTVFQQLVQLHYHQPLLQHQSSIIYYLIGWHR